MGYGPWGPQLCFETPFLCLQVGPTQCLPVWRRHQGRSARGRVPPSCRTSTSGTWPPVSGCEGPGRRTRGAEGLLVWLLMTWYSCRC